VLRDNYYVCARYCPQTLQHLELSFNPAQSGVQSWMPV